ncbi:uncharacterized protein LOC144447479 isoform X2 [Glandiceps talaboti]
MSAGHPDEKKGEGQYHGPPPTYQPTHGQAYPMQQTYPTQTGQYPQYAMPPQQGYVAAPAGYPQGPPPPYTAQGGHPAYPPQMQAQYAPQPTQAYAAPGAFDAGARFGVGSTVNIPPPPPGVAPNAAQMASMQGQNVVVGQRKGDWFSGGSDGGYVWW